MTGPGAAPQALRYRLLRRLTVACLRSRTRVRIQRRRAPSAIMHALAELLALLRRHLIPALVHSLAYSVAYSSLHSPARMAMPAATEPKDFSSPSVDFRFPISPKLDFISAQSGLVVYHLPNSFLVRIPQCQNTCLR